MESTRSRAPLVTRSCTARCDVVEREKFGVHPELRCAARTASTGVVQNLSLSDVAPQLRKRRSCLVSKTAPASWAGAERPEESAAFSRSSVQPRSRQRKDLDHGPPVKSQKGILYCVSVGRERHAHLRSAGRAACVGCHGATEHRERRNRGPNLGRPARACRASRPPLGRPATALATACPGARPGAFPAGT